MYQLLPLLPTETIAPLLPTLADRLLRPLLHMLTSRHHPMDTSTRETLLWRTVDLYLAINAHVGRSVMQQHLLPWSRLLFLCCSLSLVDDYSEKVQEVSDALRSNGQDHVMVDLDVLKVVLDTRLCAFAYKEACYLMGQINVRKIVYDVSQLEDIVYPLLQGLTPPKRYASFARDEPQAFAYLEKRHPQVGSSGRPVLSGGTALRGQGTLPPPHHRPNLTVDGIEPGSQEPTVLPDIVLQYDRMDLGEMGGEGGPGEPPGRLPEAAAPGTAPGPGPGSGGMGPATGFGTGGAGGENEERVQRAARRKKQWQDAWVNYWDSNLQLPVRPRSGFEFRGR